MKHRIAKPLLALALACAGPALADEVQVAVAANFTAPMKTIAAADRLKGSIVDRMPLRQAIE